MQRKRWSAAFPGIAIIAPLMAREIPYHLQEFRFADERIEIFVPDETALRGDYITALESGEPVDFPFWGRVWPSAIALCQFIVKEKNVVAGKILVELGAGLGLPSLLAARYAGAVLCTDISAAAVDCIRRSVRHNQIANVEVAQVDWSGYTPSAKVDVVLLSDVNYAAGQLMQVKTMIESLLKMGTTVVLATPERLVARDLIDSMKLFTRQKETCDVEGQTIHILLLATPLPQ